MVARIRTRVDARVAVGQERARSFLVTISADDPHFIGTITSVNALGEPSARALRGTVCADVVDALALVAAMTLRPELRTTETPLDGRSSADASSGTTANVPPPSTVPTNRRSDANEPARALPPDALEIRRSEGASRFRLHGGGEAELTYGYVPTALLGAGVRVEWLHVSQQVVNSAFALGISALRPTERSLGDASASLTWTVGQGVVCPTHVGLSPSVSLLPCGRVDMGRLSAVGQNIPNAQTRTLFWMSAGVLAKIAWIPLGPLVIDWEAAVLFPLTPYQFVFEPSSVLYGAPWVAFSTSVGLGIMFL